MSMVKKVSSFAGRLLGRKRGAEPSEGEAEHQQAECQPASPAPISPSDSSFHLNSDPSPSQLFDNESIDPFYQADASEGVGARSPPHEGVSSHRDVNFVLQGAHEFEGVDPRNMPPLISGDDDIVPDEDGDFPTFDVFKDWSVSDFTDQSFWPASELEMNTSHDVLTCNSLFVRSPLNDGRTLGKNYVEQKDWKDDNDAVTFSVNAADEHCFKSLVAEVNHVQKNVRHLLDLAPEERPSLFLVADIFFGEESELMQVLMTKLKLPHETLLKFFLTMLALQACNCSMSVLTDPDGLFDKMKVEQGCMSKTEWVSAWSAIANFGTGSNTHRESSLMSKLEDAFDETTRTVILAGDACEHTQDRVLDDDKIHVEAVTQGENLWVGLKRMKHVQANRWGVTCHTMVSSCTRLVSGVHFERKHDTTSKCVEKLLDGGFEDGGKPDMTNIHVGMDRGHAGNDQGSVKTVLENGGDVTTTCQRAHNFAFTFGQKLRGAADKRRIMSTDGFQCLVKKTATIFSNLKSGGNRGLKKLSQFYCRNGHGGGTTLQSTLHRENKWDRLLRTGDWRKEMELDDPCTFHRCPSHLVISESDLKIHRSLLCRKSNAKHVTTHQRCPEWFMSRMFSLTSSPAHRHFTAAHKNQKFKDRPHWKMVAECLSKTRNPDDTSESAGDTDCRAGKGADAEWASTVCQDEAHVQDTLTQLKAVSALSKEQRDGVKKVTDATSMAKIVQWARADPTDRPHLFMSDDRLKSKLKKNSKKGSPEHNCDRFSRKEIIEELKKKQPLPDKTGHDVVVSTSFMKPLDGEAKKNASIGQAMEELLAKSVMADSRDEKVNTVMPVLSMFEVGLMQNKDMEHFQDSSDNDGVTLVDGDLVPFCLELKTRAGGLTQQEEREVMKSVQGGQKCVKMNAMDPSIRHHMTKASDALQNLHHVACRDYEHALCINGLSQGKVMQGTWMQFPSELREACKSCLRDMHDECLSWAHQNRELNRSEIKQMRQAIDRPDNNHSCTDCNTFVNALSSWRVLRKSALPLLPSRKIAPHIATCWNRLKNGSDVLTRPMNNFRFAIPVGCRTPQSASVQRVLHLSQLQALHLCSMFPARKIEEHNSLDNFRNVTNQQMRSVRSHCLRLRREHFLKKLLELRCSANVCSPQEDTSFAEGEEAQALEDSICLRDDDATVEIDRTFKHGDVTNTTPRKNLNRAAAEGTVKDRLSKCEHPIAITRMKKVNRGHAKCKHKCVVCTRKTANCCLGCHMHFCNDTPKVEKVRKGLPWTPAFALRRRRDECVKPNCNRTLNVPLGIRRTREKTNDNKRRWVDQTEIMSFVDTCCTQAHKEVLHQVAEDIGRENLGTPIQGDQ